jgi:hypothetical protein
MACPQCENVESAGPTQEQLYVDPFAAEPEPRFYTCKGCGQVWWKTGESCGFWTPLADRRAVMAAINGDPLRIGHPTVAV